MAVVNESEDEDDWRNVETGGVPVLNKTEKHKDDEYQCPMITVVYITGIH